MVENIFQFIHNEVHFDCRILNSVHILVTDVLFVRCENKHVSEKTDKKKQILSLIYLQNLATGIQWISSS